MPLTYCFEGDALAELASAAKDATQFRKPYQQGQYTNEPAFWMVKDCGVYLMNAHPNPEGRERPFVVHCKEELDLRDLHGDDYIEHLPIPHHQLDKFIAKEHGMQVVLSSEDIEIKFYRL